MVRQRPDLSAVEPPGTPANWLAVRLPTVEENLALDEALLELAHEGAAATCVRTWMATEPVVVLGSSSRAEEEVDVSACHSLGVRILRRPSGGATVLLGPGCLMWTVVSPHPHGPPPIEAVHAALLEPLANAVNEALARAADPGGVRIARRGTSDLAIVAGDVATPGTERKVSGNALRVRRHGVLYHGTLLDSFDLTLVDRVLRHPPREPSYRSRRGHGAFLANLHLGRDTLEAAVRTAFRATRTVQDWPVDRVARLVAERYAATGWTARF